MGTNGVTPKVMHGCRIRPLAQPLLRGVCRNTAAAPCLRQQWRACVCLLRQVGSNTVI